MTIKKIIGTLLCLTTLAALWSCEKTIVNDSPIKSAVKMSTSNVTTSKATITLEPYGDSLATYLVVGPLVADSVSYGTWDGVKRREYIETNGEAFPKPYSQTFTKLTPGTSYVMAYLGKRADGVVCTAPYFTQFSTGVADAVVDASVEPSGISYYYSYSATPNNLTKKFKYIFSLDEKYTSLSEEDFKKAVVKEGEESTVTLTGSVMNDKWAKAVFGVVCYDEDGVEGTFSYVEIQGADEKDVVIEVPSAVTTWESTIKLAAKAKITFKIDGNLYGYRQMTGNGGVGEVPVDHSGFCAIPIANLQGLTTAYSLNSSQGYLQPMDSVATAKELWSRMDKDKDVYVKLDLTDKANILYYIQIVPESGVYLDYDCSLLTCGGYYRAGNVKGPGYNGQAAVDPTSVTGLEPMTADICTYTNVGTDVMTTSDVSKDELEYYINDTYLANKRLTGWSFKRVSEKGNGFRFGRGDSKHVDCFIKTPALSAIPSGTDICAEIRFNRFGSNMAGNVCITTEGSGSITAAEYWTDKSTTPVDGAAKLSGGVFTIDTEVAPIVQNADKDKPQVTVKVTVTGADSSTRIKLYVPTEVTTTQGRLGVHAFKIYKK